VTHRVCTHRHSILIISGDARQHPDSVRPCHSAHTRGAGGINHEEAAERCGYTGCTTTALSGLRNVSLENIERVAKGPKTRLPELFRAALTKSGLDPFFGVWAWIPGYRELPQFAQL
jgi:hypothetical protein